MTEEVESKTVTTVNTAFYIDYFVNVTKMTCPEWKQTYYVKSAKDFLEAFKEFNSEMTKMKMSYRVISIQEVTTHMSVRNLLDSLPS